MRAWFVTMHSIVLGSGLTAAVAAKMHSAALEHLSEDVLSGQLLQCEVVEADGCSAAIEQATDSPPVAR
jgi:hypothetical protein